MPDHTLGELIDRLVTANTKLFALQERFHEAAVMHAGLDADTVGKIDTLNRERNRLMTDIDRCLDESIHRGFAAIEPRVKL